MTKQIFGDLKCSGLILILILKFSLAGAQNFVNGPFEISYPNKSFTHLKGAYKDSLPEGNWWIFSDEQPFYFTHSIWYKNGELDGLYILKLGNGTCLDSGYYKKNRKQGTWFQYGYRGELRSYQTYKNDTLHGPFMDEKTKGNYNNGRYNGKIEFLNKDDGSKVTGHYKNDIRQGEWTYSRGDRKKIINFVNDTADGPYQIYKINNSSNYPDTIIEYGSYRKQKKQGLCVQFEYRTGDGMKWNLYKRSESYFEDGKLHGKYRSFYANGVIAEEADYKNNSAEGLHITRNEFGKTITMHFRSDEYDSAEFYSSEGRLLHAYLNQTLKPYRYEKWYDQNGRLKELDSFYTINGKRKLDHYAYHDGVLTEEYHLIENKKHGRWYALMEFDAVYNNGALVKKTGKGNPNTYYHNGDRYFNKDYRDYEISNYDVYAPPTPNEYLYKRDPLQPLQEELTYTSIKDTTHIKNVVRDIQRFDTIKLHGTVIYKCYYTAWGQISSVKLIKGLHPFYDEAVLRYLYFREISGNRMVSPGWLEISFKF